MNTATLKTYDIPQTTDTNWYEEVPTLNSPLLNNIVNLYNRVSVYIDSRINNANNRIISYRYNTMEKGCTLYVQPLPLLRASPYLI
jgi:methionyl-tRNA synthetase